MAIRPPADDLYHDLGVDRDAGPEELSAAFRRRAKELHPDARSAGPDATEEFTRVSRAYAVLRDPAQRARYDARRATPMPAGAGPPVGGERRPVTVAPHRAPGAAPTPRGGTGRWHLTRRTARRMIVAGIVLVVLGILAGGWVVTIQRRDAELRARGVAAVATVVDVGAGRRLEFTTRAGRTVVASEVTKSGSIPPALGTHVGVHYDRADPTRIVADESHTARDFTLWIVAVKFLVGGLVLAGVGLRRLRR
jgi:hypothetical protein